jgi:L-iditol 2-dehydrogenase
MNRDAFWEHSGLWGTWGFADYRLVRPRGLQRIAANVPLEHASLAEPLSCAVHGMSRMGLHLGDEVVVIGAGAMGLLNAQVFTARGAVVTVLDLLESRCERALRAGVAHAFVPDDSTIRKIHDMTDGRGPDIVIVASSSPKAYELGRALLGPLGQMLAFAAVYPPTSDLVDWAQVHRSELSFVGAVSSDIEDIRIAAKVISSSMFDLSPVVEAVVPFDRFQEALDLAIQPDTYRVILRM